MMMMMSGDDSNTVSEMTGLTCSVCGEFYVEPRLLQCLHTFCTKCIEGFEQDVARAVHRGTSKGDGPSSAKKKPQVNSLGSFKDSAVSDGYESDKSNSSPTDSLDCGGGDDVSSVRTVLCPKCDDVVQIPADGASHLPLNYVLQNKIVKMALETQEDDVRQACNLCLGHVKPIAWCFECSIPLCGFCSEAHKRQRVTNGHHTRPLNRLPKVDTSRRVDARRSSGRDSRCPVCPVHPMEELRLFCKSCGVTCCRACVTSGGGHVQHECCPVSEVAAEQVSELRNLFQRVLPKTEAVRRNLDDVRGTAKRIQIRRTEVVGEIDDHFDGHVKAIEQHRRNLKDRVTGLCETKTRMLKFQSIQLERTLEELGTACDFVRQLLADGTDVEIVTLLGRVGHRIRKLGADTHRIDPRVDSFLQFVPDESGGVVAGISVGGIVTAQRVSPKQCNVKGAIDAHQGRKCDVLLVTKDAEGTPMQRGGAHPKAELTSKETPTRTIPVKVIDRKDGAYLLTFKANDAGLFFLSIKIDDKHVLGSPYPIPVKAKGKVHTGIYHCCVFCSSGGSKEVQCGCRGTMLGGFKGCGHGHDGHPGKRHWSCCGHTDEISDCTRPVAKILHFTL